MSATDKRSRDEIKLIGGNRDEAAVQDFSDR